MLFSVDKIRRLLTASVPQKNKQDTAKAVPCLLVETKRIRTPKVGFAVLLLFCLQQNKETSPSLGPTKKQARHRKSGALLVGGDEEDRTLDLTDANRTLSQLSYAPKLAYGIYSVGTRLY